MTAQLDDTLALVPALRRLDALLARAAGLAGDFDGFDPPGEFERLLRRAPGEPRFGFVGELAPWPDEDDRFAWLAATFGLATFELDLLVLALAPELDLRYERLYSYLQEDASRRRPTVDLALNLLCADAAERIACRSHFAVDAPLLRHRLIALDADRADAPLLARTIRLDEQTLRFLIGEQALDSRLDGLARFEAPGRVRAELCLAPETAAALPRLDSGIDQPAPLYFEGPDRAGQRAAAEALAHEAGRMLLIVELDAVRSTGVSLVELLPVVFREAWFRGSALFINGLDLLREENQAPALSCLHRELAERYGLTMLAGDAPWRPAGAWASGVVTIPFPLPPAPARRALWMRALIDAEIDIDEETLDALAGQFRLTGDRIADAVLTLRHRRDWSDQDLEPGDFFAAARAQSSQELAAFARKISPVHDWDSLILPDEALEQLRDLRDRVRHRQRILGEWGFDRLLPLGRGISALFAGPSGVGKTMAAEVIAGELGLDLYKIDLATVVSKYIGETEKNLEAVFNAAVRANAILFFDEADAIFGKRSEVRDAHDRYANLEIAYLLQKMEQYDGVAILATNLRQHLDDAFLRRLQLVIDFPIPDEALRERMWRSFMPAAAPVDPAIDFGFLARQFQIPGGNIKNIVVSAAYQAAANGGCIGMAHLLRAARREHRKIGRRLSDAELDGYLARSEDDATVTSDVSRS